MIESMVGGIALGEGARLGGGGRVRGGDGSPRTPPATARLPAAVESSVRSAVGRARLRVGGGGVAPAVARSPRARPGLRVARRPGHIVPGCVVSSGCGCDGQQGGPIVAHTDDPALSNLHS